MGGLGTELISNDQWFGQSCLLNKTSTKKIQTMRVQGTLGVVNTSGCWEAGTPGECLEVPHNFPQSLSHASLPVGCCTFLKQIGNLK